jgi:hypothetical protein
MARVVFAGVMLGQLMDREALATERFLDVGVDVAMPDARHDKASSGKCRSLG